MTTNDIMDIRSQKTKIMIAKTIQKPFISSVQRLRGLVLIGLALGMAGSVPIATADTYDTQIQALNAQNAAVQGTIGGLQAQAASFQDAITQLNSQIYSLQAELNANQAKQTATQQQITQVQAEIVTRKTQLGADVQAMYVDGQVTSLEELASSNDLSQFIDKEEYRNTVQAQLNDKIKQITTLQAQLQQQKIDLDNLIKNQSDQQAQLAYSQSQQAQLLTYNQSQQNQYVAQLQTNSAAIKSLQAQQRAAYERAFGGGTNSSVNGTIVYRNLTGQVYCGGGYPSSLCGASQDSFFDSWGEYNRECVSYTAWYASSQGHYVPTFGNYRGAARGNANQWHSVLVDSGAADIIYGGSVTSSASVVGTIVYMPLGGVGHVGAVLGTSSEGEGWVRVGQYNIGLNGRYSEMDLKITPNLEFYRFH